MDFGGGLSGLSAAYPGYQAAETVFQDNTATKLKNDNTKIEQLGQTIRGQMLQAFGQEAAAQQPPTAVPTGPSAPPPQAPQPQTPAPGQPSVPNQPNSPMQVAPPAPPPQPQASPMGAAPSPQAAAPHPAAAALQPLLGKLDWQTIVNYATKVAPGAPPAAIAKAVDGFAPLMTATALAEWRAKSLKLQQQNADTSAGNLRQRQLEFNDPDQAESDAAKLKLQREREDRLRVRAGLPPLYTTSPKPVAPGKPTAEPGTPAAAAPKGQSRLQPSSPVPSPTVEAPATLAAAAPASTPPIAALKPNTVTTFANGQSWTLENGQPKRVK